MVNFNYTGPRILADTSKIDQAVDKSYNMLAAIEIDKQRRRQDLINKAMTFINVDIPAVDYQDQKAVSDKYTVFKDESIAIMKKASDENRDLTFEESAQLMQKKSALLKEAQAYSMYSTLRSQAVAAYIKNPDDFDPSFITHMAEIDFSKPVSERVNPMTVLSASILKEQFDIAKFSNKVGNVNTQFITNEKGVKTLDESRLRTNIETLFASDDKALQQGIQQGLWTDVASATDYMLEYKKQQFVPVTPRDRVGKAAKDIPYHDTETGEIQIQPQDFSYQKTNYRFVTSVDVQIAGVTNVNGQNIKPISIGMLPQASVDITVNKPLPGGLFTTKGSKTIAYPIKAGTPIPLEYMDQVPPEKVEYKPYLSYNGYHKDRSGSMVLDTEMSIKPYDEAVQTAFSAGTSTKTQHKYIMEFVKNPGLIPGSAAAKQTPSAAPVAAAKPTAKPNSLVGTPQAKPAAETKTAPTTTTSKPTKMQPIQGFEDKDVTAIIGKDNITAMIDSGALKKNPDGTYIFTPRTQEEYDYFVKAMEKAGYGVN